MQRLEVWSGSASQIERNAVYDALFAISTGCVSSAYSVAAARENQRDFVVLVRENLIIRIRLYTSETFGIEYIGPPEAGSGTGGRDAHAA